MYISCIHVFKKKRREIHQIGFDCVMKFCERSLIYSDREAETRGRLVHLTPQKYVKHTALDRKNRICCVFEENLRTKGVHMFTLV